MATQTPQRRNTKLVEVPTVCMECAGAGIVPHHHVTNKRNKKKCPKCKGLGAATRLEEVVVRN